MLVSTLTTTNLDEARSVIDRHFYPTFVDVLSPGAAMRARFGVSPPEALTVGDLTFGTDVRLNFGELGAYHVDVLLSGRLVWRQGRAAPRVATPGEAAVFQPVGPTRLDHWSADCRMLAVKIDKGLLEGQLSRMLDAPVTRTVRFGPTLDLSRGPGSSWLRLLRLLTADAARPDGLTRHPALDAPLRESLVTGLLLAADHQYRDLLDTHRVAHAAPRSVRRVVEAMHAQPGRQFTVVELADIAGVSPRSLQQSFQRHLGTSPMAYLRDLRLGLVHDRLRQAEPGAETVAAAAYHCGFTHLGRFAAVYRRRYGVPPAQTLRG